VAITRPKEQGEELAKIIAARGGVPCLAPTLEIKPARSLDPIEDFADRMITGRVDCVLFMSRNAVAHLMEALSRLGMDEEVGEAFSRVKVVTVGSHTRRELEDRGIKVNLTPEDYSSEGVIRLFRKIGLHGKSIIVLRAGNPSEYVKRELMKMFADVLEIPVYESVLPSDKADVIRLIDELVKGVVDVITFTSPATAQNLFKIAEERNLSDKLGACLREKVVVAAIGPVTQRTLEELGVKVHVVPREYTVMAMVNALEGYLRGRVTGVSRA